MNMLSRIARARAPAKKMRRRRRRRRPRATARSMKAVAVCQLDDTHTHTRTKPLNPRSCFPPSLFRPCSTKEHRQTTPTPPKGAPDIGHTPLPPSKVPPARAHLLPLPWSLRARSPGRSGGRARCGCGNPQQPTTNGGPPPTAAATERRRRRRRSRRRHGPPAVAGRRGRAAAEAGRVPADGAGPADAPLPARHGQRRRGRAAVSLCACFSGGGGGSAKNAAAAARSSLSLSLSLARMRAAPPRLSNTPRAPPPPTTTTHHPTTNSVRLLGLATQMFLTTVINDALQLSAPARATPHRPTARRRAAPTFPLVCAHTHTTRPRKKSHPQYLLLTTIQFIDSGRASGAPPPSRSARGRQPAGGRAGAGRAAARAGATGGSCSRSPMCPRRCGSRG